MLDFTKSLPVFVITLREGFEAALIVGIVLACLKKAGQSSLVRWVYQGIVGGLVASILTGLLLAGVLQEVTQSSNPFTPVLKQLLAGSLGIVAIVLLSWMLVWMSKQAKSIKSEVEATITKTLGEQDKAKQGVFLIVFIAVLREGFETVLFILTQFQEGWKEPTIGAIAGLVGAVILGLLLFKWGVKIDIRRFFQVMGVFLILVVGGLVIGVLNQFNIAATLLTQLNPEYANWCVFSDSCLLGSKLWDASNILPERQFPGILLKALFGYRQVIYSIQAIVYLVFISSLSFFYFKSLDNTTTKPTKPLSVS